MNRRTPTAARITAFSAAALALGACSADGGSEDAGDGAEARGSYDIDPATGETRAQYTGDDGTTTTLRSGEKVPVALPAGFTIYPEARVTNNTRVEQGAGQLVLVTPRTGRMHQIRAHLSHIGRPILGDGYYGGEMRLAGKPVPRLMLHALSLKGPHPDGGALYVDAPPPADFRIAAEGVGASLTEALANLPDPE